MSGGGGGGNDWARDFTEAIVRKEQNLQVWMPKEKDKGPGFVIKRTGELPERASGLCSGELAAFWNKKWWGFSLNKSMRKNGLGMVF